MTGGLTSGLDKLGKLFNVRVTWLIPAQSDAAGLWLNSYYKIELNYALLCFLVFRRI
jgi:hypothetical protein